MKTPASQPSRWVLMASIGAMLSAPTLAQAQFRDLQEPGPDENPITVPITRTPDEIVDRVLAELA